MVFYFVLLNLFLFLNDYQRNSLLSLELTTYMCSEGTSMKNTCGNEIVALTVSIASLIGAPADHMRIDCLEKQ